MPKFDVTIQVRVSVTAENAGIAEVCGKEAIKDAVNSIGCIGPVSYRKEFHHVEYDAVERGSKVLSVEERVRRKSKAVVEDEARK